MIPLRFTGWGLQHSHDCASSSWTENSFALSPHRAEAFQQRPADGWSTRKASDLGRGGKREQAGRKGPSTPTAVTAVSLLSLCRGPATSCKAQLWGQRSAQQLCIRNSQTFTLHPYRNIARMSHYLQHVILQYIILLLNQDNTTIKNNIIITCSTMKKFCI